MILLQNGVWKRSLVEDGIHVPRLYKIATAMVLLVASFFIAGCDIQPLEPNPHTVDFWEQILRTEDHVPVTAMVFTTQGDIVIAEYGRGIKRYAEVNGVFELLGSHSFSDNTITELHSDSTTGFLYTGTFTGALYRSTDFGVSWNDITPIVETERGFLNYVSGIETNSLFELLASFSHNGVYYSSDFGSTWTNIIGPPVIEGVTTMALTASNNLYVGTMNQGIFQGGSFAGIPFWTVTTGFTHQVSKIIVDSSDNAFVGTDNGRVYTWTDEGFGEATGTEPLPGSIMDILFTPGGTLYIAVENTGVWRIGANVSGNEQVNAGLYERRGRAMVLDAAGYLYLATQSEGIFRSIFPVQFFESIEIEG
jgi:hypothetical protein